MQGGVGQRGHSTKQGVCCTRREGLDNHFTSLGHVSPLACNRVAPHCTLFVQLNVKCFAVKGELWAIFVGIWKCVVIRKERDPTTSPKKVSACVCKTSTSVLPPRLTRQKRELSKRIRCELPTSRRNVQPLFPQMRLCRWV